MSMAKTGLARLAEAVRTKRTATLAWVDGGGRQRTIPVRLLGDEPTEDGFWAEVPEAPRDLLRRCASGEAQMMMGISSESAPPVFFETFSMRCRRRLLGAPRLLLANPLFVEVMERRRGGGREQVPDGMRVEATVRPAARPEESLAGQVCDLSTGGAGIRCKTGQACGALRAGDGVLVTIDAEGRLTTLRAQVVGIRADGRGALRLGVRYLADDPSNAGALAAIGPLVATLREVGVVRHLREKLRVRV